jgi:TnpA family transposase
MTALCLRILQAALVFVNTLMLRDVLSGKTWSRCSPPRTAGG